MDENEKASFDGLRVGQPSVASTLKDRWSKMGGLRKSFIAVCSIIAIVNFISGFAFRLHGQGHRHHRPHGKHRHAVWAEDHENWAPSPSRWEFDQGSILFGDLVDEPVVENDVFLGKFVFDRSDFKSKHHRHDFAVDVPEGIDARLVVSKGDVNFPTFFVESAWTDQVPSTDLVLTKHQDTLNFMKSDASDFSHLINFVIPQDAQRVPRLYIRSHNGLPISFDDEQLPFEHLELVTESDIELDDDIVAEHVRFFTSSGTIKGSYNVSKALILMTETGDISANVTIYREDPPEGLPHGPPGHKHPDHPPHGQPPHKDEGATGSDVDIDGPRDDDHHRRGKKGGCNGGPSFLARLFGMAKRHPHPPPPPPTPFVGLYTVTGSIEVDVKPRDAALTDLSVVVKTTTVEGNILVHVSEFFKGFFKAETVEGDVVVGTEGNKTVEIVKEVVTETGAVLEGFVKINGSEQHPHPPHHPDHDPEHHHHHDDKDKKHKHKDKKHKHKKDKKDKKHKHKKHHHKKEVDEYDAEAYEFELEDQWEVVEIPPAVFTEGGPEGRFPPPHKGPEGPHHPHGPPPPPPPPPPHPPHGPHGPHGPHDGPHAPPGEGAVIAKTEVGNIKLQL